MGPRSSTAKLHKGSQMWKLKSSLIAKAAMLVALVVLVVSTCFQALALVKISGFSRFAMASKETPTEILSNGDDDDSHIAEANHLHSPCSHVAKLYNRPQKFPKAAPNPNKQLTLTTSWDMSKERILVMSANGGPLADTVHDLLEMGFPSESIYTICMFQNCWLLPYSDYVVEESGLGTREWADRSVTGTDPIVFEAISRIQSSSRERWWENGAKSKNTFNEFFRAIVNNAERGWDGGTQQLQYNQDVGDALSHFTAVICPFPSKLCLPFLDDNFSHLKVILRLSHRISRQMSDDIHTLSMVKRLASKPSRFLIASTNAFDMAAMESLSLGNNWLKKRDIYALDKSSAKGLDHIPLQVLFWPSYYRHVRDFSTNKPQELSSVPLVIEVGASSKQITEILFKTFLRDVKSEQHKWRVAETYMHNLTSHASLAIVFPYSTHSAKVNELYALSIPMIAPSIDLLIKLGKRMQPSQVQPQIEMSDQFLSKTKPPKLCYPNASASPLHHWTAWSDVYTHPFLHYFDSFQDLPKLIDQLFDDPNILDETRSKMKQYWDESYNKTSKFVYATLENYFAG